ncbi:outer membrane protein assembly factor BamD [Rheinheimera baltica]|uniref:Outer membrane protein assembly factor BamD n=1 Tax=Rheinheimera baltica TaxID=67576 RepID=A0ABT9I2B6_9GAMM|nr:outer membrane protein assembly factor BamD [Rheinheimera baltica]MDP5137526.1 outer membrane protein assembly factor BamD [Rheinheimera baltica]MDP5143270.1 outer membrane protein assembly factor BamD [Rheinheimera baltica]MDP5150008.1 outer membrane protein assembly factor BamD [Rheinheimera baltica]MDP5189882.1 outer membrane protein assembly factor BamD [Rheinheimera baltica]
MKANFLLISMLALTLTACAGKPKDVPNSTQTAQTMYQQAKEVLDKGLYNRAIEMLSAVENRYPFGPLARQIQLDLIYAYYKAGDVQKALASIDRFIRLNPNHPELDYVYYMRGLSNLQADENALHDAMGINRADRDLASTRQAFDDFKIMISSFPQSKYAAEAKKRMLSIKDTLAQHELLIADYYMRRGAYLAAANRGKYIVEFYRDSVLVEQALEVMVESYDKLGLTKLKEDTYQVLKLNFPQNNTF